MFYLLAVVFTGLMCMLPQSATHQHIRVAFIGNSITFVNDLPRFMEALSNNHISQNSCLHGATRLRTILNTGNGMYNKWRTGPAVIQEINADDDLINYIADEDDDYYSWENWEGSDDDNIGNPETQHIIYDFGE